MLSALPERFKSTDGSMLPVIIALVIDSFDQLNNGTTITAYRFAQELRKRGHTVRVVSTGEPGPDKYIVPEKYWPIATPIAHKQGVIFAKADPAVFRRAFEGADIVHLLMPFTFERKAMEIAREMGVPCSAAFHVQPENVTYIIHMSHSNTLVRWIYRLFHYQFYHHFSHIHCPTQFIADQLETNDYKAKLHVISNGVDDAFVPAPETKKADDGLFRILMVGRLSPEKRQKVLIDAVSRSKYAHKIQLCLAGKGPLKDTLVRHAKKLSHPLSIGFYTQDELIDLIHACDLYVHASVVEIEAISCLEALSCGLVPVICDSKLSATRQFALDERSLFAPDDAAMLAQKIDYWIEHPQELEQASGAYAELGNSYRLRNSIEKAEEMFRETIEDDRVQRRT